MSNDTLSAGLANDRYLKAVRLVEDFEDEVFEALGEILDDIIASQCSDLFDHDEDHDVGKYRDPGPTYGTLRVEGTLVETDHEGNNLMLNIGLEWADPETQGIDAWSEPLLCYVYYKIKYAPAEPFKKVAEITQASDEWDAVRVGDELWDSGQRVAPGIFYVPVGDGDAVDQGLSILADHCTTYLGRMTD